MGWRSQLLWPNLSGVKLEFQPENSKAPSEDPILQSQTTGIWIQRIDPPYCTPKKNLLEPLREKDAKWLFLESLKYIYLNYSRKSQEFVWFYWSGTSKGT
jgi:hypothetical protein